LQVIYKHLEKNLYSVKQEPHELEQDYIRRIKQLDSMKYDHKLFADKSSLENNKQLMKNLKEVISDDIKISEIVKSYGNDEVFDINKYWAKIKDTILKVFGPNNKQATTKTYIEFITVIIETIDTKGSISTVLPTTTGTHTTSSITPVPSTTTIPKVYEYEYLKDATGVENVLRIANPSSNIKKIYKNR
jgi:hypothetical protein